MTITLRPETAKAVAEAARQHGMTVDQWVDECLQMSSPPAQTADVSPSAADELPSSALEQVGRVRALFAGRDLGDSVPLLCEDRQRH